MMRLCRREGFSAGMMRLCRPARRALPPDSTRLCRRDVRRGYASPESVGKKLGYAPGSGSARAARPEAIPGAQPLYFLFSSPARRSLASHPGGTAAKKDDLRNTGSGVASPHIPAAEPQRRTTSATAAEAQAENEPFASAGPQRRTNQTAGRTAAKKYDPTPAAAAWHRPCAWTSGSYASTALCPSLKETL